MFLNVVRHKLLRQVFALWLICLVGAAALAPASAQQATPAPGAGGVKWKICQPGVCFATKAAKDKYAQDNGCQFLEDVCKGGLPEQDHRGATQDDSGIFGTVWGMVKDKLKYGYEFVKGIVFGLKEQVLDLWELATNIDEVVEGLVNLGKAFYNDPKGTMREIGMAIGQGAVDTLTKATECGAYDQGYLIGQNFNPFFAFKIASKLAKLPKVPDARKEIEVDHGCTSFVAGTMVWTKDGLQPIDSIRFGQMVYSRNEATFADSAQRVTNTFSRIAPSYRRLHTEQGSLEVTDEHPLWVQGRGWVNASEVAVDDVIAAQQGDLLVVANEAVQRAVAVYNFSVANTANYFVGAAGMWAHNAACDLVLVSKPWNKLTPKERGFKAEYDIFHQMEDAGFEPVGNSYNFEDTPVNLYAGWDGQTGIDGLYKRVVNGKTEYVIIESKAHGDAKPDTPSDRGKLRVTKKTGRQMSDKWILGRLDKMNLTPQEKADIAAGINAPGTNVKRIYAQTDAAGTSYFEIDPVGKTDAKIGNKWHPKKQ